MKKILSLMLVLIMLMSTVPVSAFARGNETESLTPPDSVTTDKATPDEVTPDEVTPDEATYDEATSDETTEDEATADEATTDEATTDEATTDEATSDETSADEATTDEATTDEEFFAKMVYDYFLELSGGENPFEKASDGYFDGYKLDYELDIVYRSGESDGCRYLIMDLNYPEESSDIRGEAVVKVGDSLMFNEVHSYVPHLGMGYYVVLPETGEVMQLRDALSLGIDGLKAVCVEKDILRLIGDVTADGKLDIRDATYIQKIIADFEGYENEEYYGMGYDFSIADFDGDKDVNIRDVTNIQKYLADLPFDFMGGTSVNFTECTHFDNPLEIHVIKDKDGDYSEEENLCVIIKSTEEFLNIIGEESQIYNEAFFREKNLIYVRRTFGSGSFDIEIKGAYIGDNNRLYLNTCFMIIPPGGAATDDVVVYRAFVAVDKTATENVETVVVLEDTDFR